MKFFKKPLAVIMVISMLFSMMVPGISAAGAGTASDPYVLENKISQDIIIAVGESAYVQIDASENDVSLTVSGNRTYYDYTVQYGNTEPLLPNGLANVSVTLGSGAGNSVFAINNTGETEITLSVTMEIFELGTELKPAPAVEKNLGAVTYYFMNTDLAADDQDGYWWTYTAQADGVVCINHSTTSEYDYQVRLINGTTESLAFDGVTSNPVTTFPVSAGDEIIVNVYAEPTGRTIPAMSLTISAELYTGEATTYDAVPVKGADGFKAYVPSGETISYINNANGAPYTGKGLVVTGYSEAIAVTTVTVDGVEYTDEDGDGKIELTLPSNDSTLIVAPMISITNGHAWNIAYTATVTDFAGEGFFEKDTNHKLTYHEAIAPVCHTNGMNEYWYCGICDVYYANAEATEITSTEALTIPADSEIIHFEAVEPGCHMNGNIEYWFCSDCEGFWQDEALTQLTNSKNIILPAVGSENVVRFDAIDPACHYNGNIEYWYCPDCEQFWADEALTQLTNSKSIVLPATGSENLRHVEAVAATCYENGSIEYWYCPDCDQYFQDEACTQITNAKNIITPALEHKNVIRFDAVDPGCHSNGNIEYWFCPDCEAFWQDEALTQLTNSKSVILPAVGSENVVHFDAVEPGCHMNGNIEYWFCPDCEGFWQDEALTQLTNSKSVVLPATGSENVVHFDAVAPGCHMNGNIEYWFCPDCEGFWQDEALTQLTNSKSVVLPATGSENLQHVDAVAATCTENGNIEYWFCPDCECFWQNEALTQLTNSKSVITPATGHTYENGKCSVCGESEPSTHVPGDVNGDDSVDSKDLTRLMKYIAGEDVGVTVADINGDGTVNTKDLTRLMKYIAGEDVEIF